MRIGLRVGSWLASYSIELRTRVTRIIWTTQAHDYRLIEHGSGTTEYWVDGKRIRTMSLHERRNLTYMLVALDNEDEHLAFKAEQERKRASK